MAKDAPPYPSEIEIVPTDAPTTTTSVGSRRKKDEVLRKASKLQNPCPWNTMYWVNPVANAVGNMENKSAYVSVRFLFCTHGTRFQRV